MFTCGKCNGKGLIREFGHVKMGRCFECDGKGKVSDRAKSTIANESAERIVAHFADRARFYGEGEWEAVVAWVNRAYERGENPVEIRGKLLESSERKRDEYWAKEA